MTTGVCKEGVRGGTSKPRAKAAAMLQVLARGEEEAPPEAASTRGSPTLVRPGPVPHVRVVLAVLSRPRAEAKSPVLHLLTQPSARVDEPRNTVDHVDHEVEAVEVVEHDHVERRRGRALLLVAAHVQVAMVRAPVREPVDQPW